MNGRIQSVSKQSNEEMRTPLQTNIIATQGRLENVSQDVRQKSAFRRGRKPFPQTPTNTSLLLPKSQTPMMRSSLLTAIPPSSSDPPDQPDPTAEFKGGPFRLSLDGSPVALYNPYLKMFKCILCDNKGFLSRAAEHYLGAHAEVSIFRCPDCPYTSCWSRCVLLHMGKVHNLHKQPSVLWTTAHPLLDETLKLLQNLKDYVERETFGDLISNVSRPPDIMNLNPRDLLAVTMAAANKQLSATVKLEHDVTSGLTTPTSITNTNIQPNLNSYSVLSPLATQLPSASLSHPRSSTTSVASTATTPPNLQFSTQQDFVTKLMKRYKCTKCPYATDRRDLFNRHENIHKDDKPFHCYICLKLFNRADHVKKHFLRIHRQDAYDISLIRRPKLTDVKSNGGSSKTSEEQIEDYCGDQSAEEGGEEGEIEDMTMLQPETTLTVGGSGQELNSWIAANTVTKRNTGEEQPFDNDDLLVTHDVGRGRLRTQSVLSDGVDLIPSTSKQAGRSTTSPTGNFQCSFCSWKGVDGWCLRRHLNTHLRPFRCNYCDYKAARSERLNAHVLRVHNKHLCARCQNCFDDPFSLGKHMRDQHINSCFSTKKRGSTSVFVSATQTNVSANDSSTDDGIKEEVNEGGELKEEDEEINDGGDGLYLCADCGLGFADKLSIRYHKEMQHPHKLLPEKVEPILPTFPFKCSICAFSSFTQPTMMEHMGFHAGLSLKCRNNPNCRFSTPFDTVMMDHVREVHGNDEGVAKCPHCSLAVNSGPAFETHISAAYHHSPNGSEWCKECKLIMLEYFPEHFGSVMARFPPSSVSIANFSPKTITIRDVLNKSQIPESESTQNVVDICSSPSSLHRLLLRSYKQMLKKGAIDGPTVCTLLSSFLKLNGKIESSSSGAPLILSKFIEDYKQKLKIRKTVLKMRHLVKKHQTRNLAKLGKFPARLYPCFTCRLRCFASVRALRLHRIMNHSKHRTVTTALWRTPEETRCRRRHRIQPARSIVITID